MKQNEFLNNLRTHLSSISKDEQDRIIEYYYEIINDKIEAGQSEEQIIEELGSPKKIADSVINDYNDNENKFAPKHSKKTSSIGQKIGFSILIPFVLIAIVTLGSIIISFVAVAITFLASGLVFFITSFIVMSEMFAAGLFQLGQGLLLIAIGIFANYGCIILCKKFVLNIVVRIFKKYVKVYGGN